MNTEASPSSPVREQLILTGLQEIEAHGLDSFSIRRVAAVCGLSCAAPYKHFSGRRDFILAIIDYVNQEWLRRSLEIEERFAGNTRQQLVELSMAYIHFLLENPHFRSILMLWGDSLDDEQLQKKTEVSTTTQRLISRYCQETSMPEDIQQRKTFIIRSLICGGVLMLENGQLPREENSFRLIAAAIDREFDLP